MIVRHSGHSKGLSVHFRLLGESATYGLSELCSVFRTNRYRALDIVGGGAYNAFMTMELILFWVGFVTLVGILLAAGVTKPVTR